MEERTDNQQDQDKGSKHLDPTEHTLNKALKEGKTPISQELSHLAFLVGVMLSVYLILPPFMPSVLDTFAYFLGPIHMQPIAHDHMILQIKHLIYKAFLPLLIFLGVLFLSIMGLGSIQSYKAITVKLIIPKISHLSLKRGWQKIFSKQIVINFLKMLVKLFFLYTIVWLSTQSIVWTHMIYWSIPHIGTALSSFFFRVVLYLSLMMFVVFLFDFLYQRWQHIRNLRMSHRDLREEQKETEVRPEVRQKQRRLAQQRKRMMATVPHATVVVTNPTHYAVALLWKEDQMNAPTVVAKGRDTLAHVIRQIAQEHTIPLVENPPLARALYDQVELDAEIPPEHYQAVADIIRWVSRLGRNEPVL